MVMTDLEYLEKTDKESNNRLINDEELLKIREVLRANKYNLSAILNAESIAYKQSQLNNVEKLQELTDDIIQFSKHLEYTPQYAQSIEMMIAAKFLDNGQYSKFNQMLKNGFDSSYKDFTGLQLIDRVKTLKGAEFMEKEGLIPDKYFTEGNSQREEPSLLRAYPEQIDFYIAHGADINAKDEFGQTVLDKMIYASRPAEAVEHICKLGGRANSRPLDLLQERLTDSYEDQKREYGEKSIENSLKNIIVLQQYGEKSSKEFYNDITSNPELFEKYPELMSVILQNEDPLQMKLNALQGKIALENEDAERDFDFQKRTVLNEYYPEGVNRFGIRRKKRETSSSQDLPLEKETEMKKRLEEIRKKKKEQMLQIGKTGASNTGETSETHKKTAKKQTETAHLIMKIKQNQKD